MQHDDSMAVGQSRWAIASFVSIALAGGLAFYTSTELFLVGKAGITAGIATLFWLTVAVALTVLAILLLTVALIRSAIGRSRWTLTVLAAVACALIPLTYYVSEWWWPTPNSFVLAAGAGDIAELDRSLRLGVDVDVHLTYVLGFDPATAKQRGDTALTAAVKSHRIETVRWLLEHGADVNLTDGDGLTPLHHAIAIGEAEIVDQLDAHGANPTPSDE